LEYRVLGALRENVPVSSLQTRDPRGRLGFLEAGFVMALLVALLWVVEGVDQADAHRLDQHGIEPRSGEGLVGILLAPFLHASWGHLVSNTFPFFVLGLVVLLDGLRRWGAITLWIVVVSGATVWLIAPGGTVTLGASGVIFGWLTYLLARGLYTRAPGQIAVGVVVLLFYGTVLLGVIPTDSGISWQAHLGGAVGGLLAASRQRRHAVDPRWR
jgi:membrane associated rhomboid family serine protease